MLNFQENIKNQMADLIEANNIEEEFYKILEDKKIEIKNPKDIERIEVLFNNNLNKMLDIIKEGSYDEEETIIIRSRFIIDFHVRLAERYNIDPYLIASFFGPNNEKIFTESVANMKRFT